MSDESKSAGGNGIGAAGLLGVAFVILKLTGHIHWSWFWVTLPFWGGLALVLAIVVIALIGAAIVSAATGRK